MTNLHDLTGTHNMAVTYVRLAPDEAFQITDPCDFAEDFYLVRSVDPLPVVMSAADLFDGIGQWND